MLPLALFEPTARPNLLSSSLVLSVLVLRRHHTPMGVTVKCSSICLLSSMQRLSIRYRLMLATGDSQRLENRVLRLLANVKIHVTRHRVWASAMSWSA